MVCVRAIQNGAEVELFSATAFTVNRSDAIAIKVCQAALVSLWSDQALTQREISQQLGITMSMLWKLSRQWKLPRRVRHGGGDVRPEADDPTEDEIRDAAERIRESWTMKRLHRNELA